MADNKTIKAIAIEVLGWKYKKTFWHYPDAQFGTTSVVTESRAHLCRPWDEYGEPCWEEAGEFDPLRNPRDAAIALKKMTNDGWCFEHTYYGKLHIWHFCRPKGIGIKPEGTAEHKDELRAECLAMLQATRNADLGAK